MLYDIQHADMAHSDAIYALVCELKQAAFDRDAFDTGLAANLRDPHYHLALAWLDAKPVGLVSLHLQFHLHHANWIGEIQELVVMPDARSAGVGKRLLAWAHTVAQRHGAEMTELSTNVKRIDAHRFYRREGYEPSHVRFTKPL